MRGFNNSLSTYYQNYGLILKFLLHQEFDQLTMLYVCAKSHAVVKMHDYDKHQRQSLGLLELVFRNYDELQWPQFALLNATFERSHSFEIFLCGVCQLYHFQNLHSFWILLTIRSVTFPISTSFRVPIHLVFFSAKSPFLWDFTTLKCPTHYALNRWLSFWCLCLSFDTAIPTLWWMSEFLHLSFCRAP